MSEDHLELEPPTFGCLGISQSHRAKQCLHMTYRTSTSFVVDPRTDARWDFVTCGRRGGVMLSPGWPASTQMARRCRFGRELNSGFRAMRAASAVSSVLVSDMSHSGGEFASVRRKSNWRSATFLASPSCSWAFFVAILMCSS